MYQSGPGYKNTNQRYHNKKKIREYIIDETAIKAGSSELIWLWIVIEPAALLHDYFIRYLLTFC